MSMTAFSSRVYLLRHGELTTKDVLAGHTDFILSKKGFEQLNIACGRRHLTVKAWLIFISA